MIRSLSRRLEKREFLGGLRGVFLWRNPGERPEKVLAHNSHLQDKKYELTIIGWSDHEH
jgi:hypothetical protein